MKLSIILMAMLCIASLPIFAQEKSNVKFGKVSPEDFKRTIYSIDSNAQAVVIADIGSTEMVGNTKGSFSLEFKRFRRVHVLNINAYDIGNVEIPFYTDGRSEEELISLKAVTYNMENGKLVETRLDKGSAMFKDKISKNLVIKKFAFPNIKEGSIIEYEYKTKSDFTFNLQPWTFQEQYPVLWSEYNVSMPEFYYYVTFMQGFHPFHIRTTSNETNSFSVADNSGTGATERMNFTAGVTDYKWVMKDVPALKPEGFTSTIRNHIARIEFQLAELRPPFQFKNVMGSWEQVCKELLADPDFGYSLNRDNHWLNDVVSDITKNAKTDLEKARSIYNYVRDNMTCTNHNSKYLANPLKTVLKNKNGNEAEINLLLTSMLSKAGLNANPVMLSSRSHGYAYPMYPLLDRFNYVISRVKVDGDFYFLDASLPRMGFGKLGYESYNGHARVIDATATPLELSADSLQEKKLTSVIIINDDKGNMTGTLRQSPGIYESYNLRNRIKEKGQADVFNDIKKEFSGDVDIHAPTIDALDNYDELLSIKYDFDIKSEKEDIIYFNPMMNEGWKENPFKSAVRNYPVEMPYAIDQTFLLKFDIPAGYKVDELPKEIMVKLNEQEEGLFEFRISESAETISMRSRVLLKRAYYQPEEYETLREFFNLIVKKHGEQIVFKKKS